MEEQSPALEKERKKEVKKSRGILIITLVIASILVFWTMFFIWENFPGLAYNQDSQTTSTAPKTIEEIQNTIVWVRYRVNGKHRDGGYFENAGGSGSGILYGRKGANYLVITNRHVVDCTYHSVSCYQRINESVSIRTSDGKMHPVTKLMFAQHNLDIAILEVYTEGEIYPTTRLKAEEVNIGESVVTIGYPRFIKGFAEFKISKGVITNKRTIVTGEGFGFEAIDSDAYTNFGSSGGGLFDSQGRLIGINTWKAGETTIAASAKILKDASEFRYCNKGFYFTNEGCIKYCKRDQVLGKDGKCQNVCDSFYCDSVIPDIKDERCADEGYVLGDDGYCHSPCSLDGAYCSPGSVCYKNRCLSCEDINMRVFKDGTCRYFE